MVDGVTEEFHYLFAITFTKILLQYSPNYILRYLTDFQVKYSSQIFFHYVIMPSGQAGLVFLLIQSKKMQKKMFHSIFLNYIKQDKKNIIFLLKNFGIG